MNHPPKSSERRVLIRTSVCQITEREDQTVEVTLGQISIRLSARELAALSGTCRTATKRLFPKEKVTKKPHDVPYLQLVPEIEDAS